MKASPKKLLPLTLIGIAVTSLFSVQPAQAYTVTLQQVGANVVANGSGGFNLTGLTFLGTFSFTDTGAIGAALAIITTKGPGDVNFDAYSSSNFTGPMNFGSGGLTFCNSGSGDLVGVSDTGGGQPGIRVPEGYVSGNTLSDSMTFNNATFASLGVTPGTYVWSWGDGANQRFTLIIGRAGVPDGGSTVSLLGCALLGVAAVRRKLGS